MADQISRREYLKRSLLLGVVTAGGVHLIAACGKDEGTGGSSAGSSAASTNCTDTSALDDQQKQVRTTLQYVDATTIADKRCDNCQQYVAATAGGQPCATCRVMPGPVSAGGYCSAWVAKQA